MLPWKVVGIGVNQDVRLRRAVAPRWPLQYALPPQVSAQLAPFALPQLAERRVLGTLAVIDDTARQHGVVMTVQVTLDDQHPAATLDDSDRSTSRVREGHSFHGRKIPLHRSGYPWRDGTQRPSTRRLVLGARRPFSAWSHAPHKANGSRRESCSTTMFESTTPHRRKRIRFR